MTGSNHATSVTTLPTDKLTVDHSVQRALDDKRVDRMAADLHMDALGVITVSHRADDTYHVIDGQHRVEALRRAGHGGGSVYCVVYRGLSRAEEAAMFVRLNETKQVQPLDRFRVRVVEGDPVAVALNTVLAGHGWRVTTGGGESCFSAVRALETVYRGAKVVTTTDNLDACDTVLGIVTAAFGHSAHAVGKQIIAGLGLVVLRHGHELDQRKLINELSKTPNGALGLISRAQGLREMRGGRVDHAMAEVIVNLHNKGRRTHRLPEWRSA